VVGVVADVKNAGLDKPTDTEAFFPYRAVGATRGFYVAVRTSGNPAAYADAVRGAISRIDPSLAVAKVQTMQDVLASANSRPRFLTAVISGFSAIALGLAMIGIYGVISYSVEQRTAEFGIKMALGARPSQLLAQVLAQGLAMAAIGIAAGGIVALALPHSLQGLVYGMQSGDHAALVLPAILLVGCAVVASLLPGIRAMRLEPVIALRYE
jgi:ABC-type antimicrobial peptide transport system permease subunit